MRKFRVLMNSRSRNRTTVSDRTFSEFAGSGCRTGAATSCDTVAGSRWWWRPSARPWAQRSGSQRIAELTESAQALDEALRDENLGVCLTALSDGRSLLGPLGLLPAGTVVRLALDGFDQLSDTAAADLTDLIDRLRHPLSGSADVRLVVSTRPGAAPPPADTEVSVDAASATELHACLDAQHIPGSLAAATVEGSGGSWLVASLLADHAHATPASLPRRSRTVWPRSFTSASKPIWWAAAAGRRTAASSAPSSPSSLRPTPPWCSPRPRTRLRQPARR